MEKFMGPKNKDIDSDAPGPKGEGSQTNYSDYEVKDAFNTLTKAEEIKANPHLMKHVAKHADKHVKAITSIKELKAHKQKVDAEKMKEKMEPQAEEKKESKSEEESEKD